MMEVGIAMTQISGAGFDLTGKIALVTGAAQGLGEAMAIALTGAGADIVLADVKAEQVHAVAKRIERSGRRALPLHSNVANAAEVDEMVSAAVDAFGHIDILVNNAGISRGAEYPPEELPHEIWDEVMAVNLRGAFYCAQSVGRQMIAQQSGTVINVASIAGAVVLRVTGRHPLAYSVSKSGLMMLTKVLAAEWARHNIRVNAIAPAYFKTAIIHQDPRSQEEMIRDIPMGRLGVPEDLAGTVIYLASESSAFVTGQVLFVDGGYTIW